MKSFFFGAVVVLLALFVFEMDLSVAHTTHFTEAMVEDKRNVHCASEMIDRWKQQKRGDYNRTRRTCITSGDCDNPKIRDSFKTTGITLRYSRSSQMSEQCRIAVIVIGENVTTQRKINDQLLTLKQYLNPYNVDFYLVA
jgi:hypothetical protein